MELLISLPAELVAVADPMARGPAPLLRPDQATADAAAPPAPFDVCLALLAMPLSAGEAWPAPGKELPAAPRDLAPATAADPGVGLDARSTTASDAALLARLRAPSRPLELLAHAAGPAAPAPVAEPVSTAANAVLSTLPEAGVFVAARAADADLATATSAPSAEALPIESMNLQASPEPSELPASVETFMPRDEGATRLGATTSGEPRQSAAPFPPGLAAEAPQPQPAAEATVMAATGLRRGDAPKMPPPGAATLEAPGPSRPDWLPPQLSHVTSAAPSAAGPPVDVRTQGWQETFANRVQWLVDSNVDEARITLHPPELGAVDVEISLVDDKTYVQLTTATAAARDELAQSLPRLRELFTVSGLELGGASVHDGRHGQRAGYGDSASSATPRSLAPLAGLIDEPPPVVLPSRSLGRIDVFA